MTVQPAEEFVTLKEAARELRLSVSTLKRYIYSGQLRSYRTPGGRHRLRRRDMAALLGAASPPAQADVRPPASADAVAEEVAERVDRVLRRRLSRIEIEVERLECSVEAISAAVRRAAAPELLDGRLRPAAGEGCEIKVLGPGCRACDRLAALVLEIARAVGIGSHAVHRVRELDEIAEYGPTPMPALVVNNQLVSAGRLPSKSRITELLRNCLSN